MREWIKILVTYSIVALLCFANGFYIGINYFPNIKIVENNNTITIEREISPVEKIFNNNNENISIYNYYLDYDYELINLLKEVSSERPYLKGNYDCVNFTEKAYNKLSSAGYSVDKYSSFIIDNNEAHALIGTYIFIETTTGEIISPKQYSYYGIDTGYLRQWKPENSMDYYSQDKIQYRKDIKICEGLK